ncbi:MAG: hypothetical protein GX970_00450 [Phyllobacteriaceae bacterium]|nr:hypothetical protein [Phyllobacteriaceae bacterium]
MTFGWQNKVARAASPIMAVCAAALVLFVTFTPAHADTRSNLALPEVMPEAIASLRAQPALGPETLPPVMGQQALTPELLANYVQRQQQLRSVDVTLSGPQPELTTDVLMGYISRGSLAGGNTALSAIDAFTAPAAAARPAPSVTPDLLASYVANGFQPTEKRVQVAEKERGCLAQAIYHEARGESAAGQLAVANVIVNRARSGKFPGSLCGVIYQNADKGRYRCQFTFACDGRDDTPGERAAWARSKELAREVYAEYAQGTEIGALPKSVLYYHTHAVSPSWSRTYNRVAVVDSHIFYAPN